MRKEGKRLRECKYVYIRSNVKINEDVRSRQVPLQFLYARKSSNLRRTNIFNLQVLSNDCNHCQYENMGECRKAYSKIRSLTVFHLKIFHRLFFR